MVFPSNVIHCIFHLLKKKCPNFLLIHMKATCTLYVHEQSNTISICTIQAHIVLNMNLYEIQTVHMVEVIYGHIKVQRKELLHCNITGAPGLCSQFLVESKLLICFCYFVCIISVTSCSLLCVSILHVWSLFLDYSLEQVRFSNLWKSSSLSNNFQPFCKKNNNILLEANYTDNADQTRH